MNTNAIQSWFFKAFFTLAFLFKPTRSAIYSRAISRWPYMQTKRQMDTLAALLLSRQRVRGSYVEVGVAEGFTTIFLHRTIAEADASPLQTEMLQNKRFFAVDTFSGFTPDDKAMEEARGQARGALDGLFCANSQAWFNESMRRAGVPVTSFKADAAKFDFAPLGPIAFCYLDCDLYHVTSTALPKIVAQLAPGGICVVDDCQEHELWSGANAAYREFCVRTDRPIDILAGKLGVVRK